MQGVFCSRTKKEFDASELAIRQDATLLFAFASFVAVEDAAQQRTGVINLTEPCRAIEETAGVSVLLIVQPIADDFWATIAKGLALCGDTRLSFSIFDVDFDDESLAAVSALAMATHGVVGFNANPTGIRNMIAPVVDVVPIERVHRSQSA